MPTTKTKTRARHKQTGLPETGDLESAALRGGPDSRSLRAFANLKVLGEEHLKGRYQIEVIDLRENLQLARGDQIVAIPTLLRMLLLPLRPIIGDLSNSMRLLLVLDLLKVDRSSSGRPM